MNKMIKCTILFLFFTCLTINAQYEFDFSGYVVNYPIYQKIEPKLGLLTGLDIDENIFVNITRTRLRPTVYLWDGARINLEYEISGVYSKSPNLFNNVNGSKTNRQIVDLTWVPVNEKEFTLTHFIDRLYFRQGFENGNIEIGRQRISWGTGRVWNPTDLFNPINPATFSKIEKDGADAVSIKYNAGDFTDLHLVFNPDEKIKRSNYGLRFRTNFEEYDVSLMSGYFDSKVVVGADFAGNLFDAGIRGEGIYTFAEDSGGEDFVKFILGVDYQFTAELYGLLEYHYNGEGKSKKLEYEFARLIEGNILNLSKNYISIMLMYQYSPLLSFSFSNNLNLNDGSGFAGITANYSVTQDFYLNLGSQITYGNELTEYWYYPNSFYLQGEFYF